MLHSSAQGGHSAMVKYLVPKMENHLFDTGDNGFTALHSAVDKGHMAVVEYLVKSCGFDVKAKTQVIAALWIYLCQLMYNGYINCSELEGPPNYSELMIIYTCAQLPAWSLSDSYHNCFNPHDSEFCIRSWMPHLTVCLYLTRISVHTVLFSIIQCTLSNSTTQTNRHAA